MVVARNSWDGSMGGRGPNVYWAQSFSVEKDENILNVYGGDGWTMLMSLMPLNWTLKNG